MRALKFRAWDKVCKKMYYNGELDNGDMMVIHLNGTIELSDTDTYRGADFHLMQFTGLLSKSGKEIFEGDVVEWVWLECNMKAVVEWDEKRAMFYAGDRRENLLSCVNVIGNRFEHPDLIK